MKAFCIWMILITYSCSAPNLSLSGETGCDTHVNTPGDDCGPGVFWRTACAVPLLQPSSMTGCHSPSGERWSTTWCCTNR